VPIRASFTSSLTIRGEEQQFLIREEQMPVVGKGPEIDKSALIIVDMQNDFLHRDGNFAHIAREHPEANIDLPFLIGTIPNVKRLADFRAAERPVVYLAHVLKPDYSDAAFPYWRLRMEQGGGNRTHGMEGTWGAQVINELSPQEGEYLVVKRGFGGFSNTPLDTILRNMGVTTCVCESTTTRGGVEYNYRMIVVSDAVAEVDRTTHEAELIAERKLRRRQLTDDGNVEITGRDLRERETPPAARWMRFPRVAR
jgi:ureidoacrylate peracid hydrolase